MVTSPFGQGIRLMQVLVADPSASPSSSSSSSSAVPTGYRMATTVQVHCPSCNYKRVRALAEVPRALCAPYRTDASSGAVYHRAVLHRGKVVCTGTGVYVTSFWQSSTRANHKSPSSNLRVARSFIGKQIQKIQQASSDMGMEEDEGSDDDDEGDEWVVPTPDPWQYDGRTHRHRHLLRHGPMPVPFLQAEQELRRSREEEAKQHANPETYTEIYRKPPPDEHWHPDKYTDFTQPLQVFCVAEIRGVPVTSPAAVTSTSSSSSSVSGGKATDAPVTLYQLGGVPLRRPYETPMSTAKAQASPANELVWPSKEDYAPAAVSSGDSTGVVPIEDAQGVCLLLNASLPSSAPVAEVRQVEAAIDSMLRGSWRDAFIIRQCLDIEASATGNIAESLKPLADVTAVDPKSALGKRFFQQTSGISPLLLPRFSGSAPMDTPQLPMPAPVPAKGAAAAAASSSSSAAASPGASYVLPPSFDPRDVASSFPLSVAPLPPPAGDGGPTSIPSLDLFAGAGGLSAGFDQAGGFHTVAANEFEQAISQAYASNHRDATVSCTDINVL